MPPRVSKCRICRRSQDPTFVPMQVTAMEGETFAGMFTYVTGILINPKEVFIPQVICGDCTRKLRACFSFRKQCEASDRLFREDAVSCSIKQDDDDDDDDVMVVEPVEASQQQQPTWSEAKPTVSYLDNYDPSFYQVAHDHEYYMELNFIAIRCCGCPEAFASEEELRIHSKNVHRQQQIAASTSSHQCTICYAQFPYRDALNFHHRSALDNLFSCRNCRQMFDKKQALFDHLRVQHQVTDDQLQRPSAAPPMSMAMGHSIFDAEEDPGPAFLVSNVQSLHGMDSFALGYCELSPGLKLTDLRPTQYTVTEQNEKFCIIEFSWHRCCACTHMFASREDLEVHCTEEHRAGQKRGFNAWNNVQKPFECQLCWRRFKKKSLLGLHQKFNRKKVYSCNDCSEIFFGGPAYEKHLPQCSSGGDGGLFFADDGGDGAEQVYVGHQMYDDVKPEAEDDDDVYILND